MSINLIKIEEVARESFENAKNNLALIKKSFSLSEQAISDTIPGFSAKTLTYGSFHQENFAVLFVDMRRSTHRAMTIGPEKTFLSMHAFIPAMLCVVEEYGGYVIDIMGDGIMVFFGGKESGIAKSIAVQNAGLCGLDMVLVVDKIVNKIIVENEILNKISVGVGCDYGNVIVTKIGTAKNYDTKAYGDCINNAAKYTKDVSMQVKVSKQIKNLWPSGEHGKIGFTASENGYLLAKKS